MSMIMRADMTVYQPGDFLYNVLIKKSTYNFKALYYILYKVYNLSFSDQWYVYLSKPQIV